MTLALNPSTERTLLYCQVAVDLIDDFTKTPPVGNVSVQLLRPGANDSEWVDTEIAPRNDAPGLYTFPGLGRTTHPDGREAQYRVRITSDFYVTEPQAGKDPIEFTVRLYNDGQPLDGDLEPPRKLSLHPNTRYSFPTHVAVIRGAITFDGAPVFGVDLNYINQERAVTDELGRFSLPLRSVMKGLWPPQDILLNEPADHGEDIIVLNTRDGLTDGRTDEEGLPLEEIADAGGDETDFAPESDIHSLDLGEFDHDCIGSKIELEGDAYEVIKISRRADSEEHSGYAVRLNEPLRNDLDAGTPVQIIAMPLDISVPNFIPIEDKNPCRWVKVPEAFRRGMKIELNPELESEE
jgi:hypothetical protein